MRRVDALDIEGRIGFRVTKRLCFGQHVGEIPPFLAHFGEDEITGAVNDSRQPLDMIAPRPSRIALIMGIPPATAASKATITP